MAILLSLADKTISFFPGIMVSKGVIKAPRVALSEAFAKTSSKIGSSVASSSQNTDENGLGDGVEEVVGFGVAVGTL